MMNANPVDFWQYSPAEILQKLNASSDGLSKRMATQRFRERAKKEKHRPIWLQTIQLFVGQFTSPLILLLVFASLLSAALGNWNDSLILGFILLLSGTVSFWQEYHANRAVQKLREMMHSTCTVLRDGKPRKINKETVVPGDIVLFAAGDLVPGDCLLLEATHLHANESALTGESFPVEKEVCTVPAATPLTARKNALFEGSSVMSGVGRALVVRTGSDTEFGKISVEMERTSPETAFQVGIRKFGNLLLRMTFLFSAGLLILNLFLGKPVTASILFSIALAVGLAPELLPAIMVSTLSAGARRMARAKVIVKKLDAIQNLGAINILCSDKTGTLSSGEVKVASALDAEGKSSERVRLYAYLNAFFESGFANPLDDAIRQMEGIVIDGFSKMDEVPYDFERKRLSIVVREGAKDLMITKGALSNVLDLCDRVETGATMEPLESRREALLEQYKTYSAQGFRTIGLAWKDVSGEPLIHKNDETGMTFLGFLLLEDPPKSDVRETLHNLNALGITLKIITGDNRLAAAHLAGQVGLPFAEMLTGQDMAGFTDAALARRALKTDLFAEIEPQQKERLIRVMRTHGNVVGFLGDGINDAPALKAADVGISVNSASDVAKEAADIVLLEKDLEVLRMGILEGRKTYLNTMKYIFITTSANFGNMFSLAGISLFLPWLPLLPAQILLLNFLSDIPAFTIASDRVDEEQLTKPKHWDIGLIRRFMIVFGVQSSLFDYLTFGLLLYVFKAGEKAFQSGWFVESVLTEITVLLLIRTVRPFFKSRPTAALLWASVGTALIAVSFPYLPFASELGLQPLPLPLLASMIGLAILYGVVVETTKRRFFAGRSL